MANKLLDNVRQKLLDAGYIIEITDRQTRSLLDKKGKMIADYSVLAHSEEEFLLSCLIVVARDNKNIHIAPEERELWEKKYNHF